MALAPHAANPPPPNPTPKMPTPNPLHPFPPRKQVGTVLSIIGCIGLQCTYWLVKSKSLMMLQYSHTSHGGGLHNNYGCSNCNWDYSSSYLMGISLRLLALILCSNCSNTFNKVLTTIGGHMLNYFLDLGGSLELAQHLPRMVMAFHTPP